MAKSDSTLKKRPKSAALPHLAGGQVPYIDHGRDHACENLEGDQPISTYAAAAGHWGLPMWAMVVPGTTRDMFEDLTKMKRMVQLMQDYLDSSESQRGNIEGMAAGLAELNRKRRNCVAN